MIQKICNKKMGKYVNESLDDFLNESQNFQQGGDPYEKLKIGSHSKPPKTRDEYADEFSNMESEEQERLSIDDITRAYNNDDSIKYDVPHSSFGKNRIETNNLLNNLSARHIDKFDIFYANFEPGDNGANSYTECYFVIDKRTNDMLILSLEPKYIAYNGKVKEYGYPAYDKIEEITEDWDTGTTQFSNTTNESIRELFEEFK